MWSNMDIVKSTLQNTCNVFPVFDYAFCSVPTYPDGQIGFVLGSLNEVSTETRLILRRTARLINIYIISLPINVFSYPFRYGIIWSGLKSRQKI